MYKVDPQIGTILYTLTSSNIDQCFISCGIIYEPNVYGAVMLLCRFRHLWVYVKGYLTIC